MLFRKLWRTMGHYKAQFISMVLMITLGVGAFIGFHMEWMTIDYNTSRFYEETGLADYRIFSKEGIKKADAAVLANKEGIDEVSRFFSANTDVKGTDGDTLALTVTENPRVSGLYLSDGEAYDEASSDGIWLSQKYAAANGVMPGDTLDIIFQNKALTFRVKGLIQAGEYTVCVRDATQIMPDYRTHGFAYISPKAYEKAVGADFYPSLYVISALDKDAFSEKAEDVFGAKPRILTKHDFTAYEGPAGECNEGKLMGSLMPPVFLLIGILTMVTTMNRLVVNEKIQIGTLKALGFRDRKILRHYTSFAVVVGVLGIFFGILLGYGVGFFIMNPGGSMGTYLDMPTWTLKFPLFCIPVLILILVFLAGIGYLSTRQMLKGNAADALRPYVPKTMKPLALEKTKVFHRFSFGTRWNLRDTMRHKMRTLMSVVGVVGCMVILIGSFGMKDSVENYVKHSYYDSMRYASRISISDNADSMKRDELVKSYEGDYSCSVGAELKNKTVLLEIYHIEKDMVRFLDVNDKPLKLGDEGVYICQRIADEKNIKKGDIIEIKLFDSDKSYTFKVADVMHSVTEGIFMTDAYAEKTDFPFVINSIYTDTVKEDIKADDAVENIQSREMIISSFDSFIEIMNSMILLLAGIGVLLGIIVLYNLGVMMYIERYRELATLKVVGFRDRQLANLLHGQTLMTTITGILLGIPAGWGVVKFVMLKMGARYEMVGVVDISSYLLAIGITLLVSLFVSMLTAHKTKKIDMVSALKGAE